MHRLTTNDSEVMVHVMTQDIYERQFVQGRDDAIPWELLTKHGDRVVMSYRPGSRTFHIWPRLPFQQQHPDVYIAAVHRAYTFPEPPPANLVVDGYVGFVAWFDGRAEYQHPDAVRAMLSEVPK